MLVAAHRVAMDTQFRGGSRKFRKRGPNSPHPSNENFTFQDMQLVHCGVFVMQSKVTLTIEGFGGKRALGFLLKIELCRKRSKFRMQFCLGALNNVLYVFFAEVFFVYEILRMQKSLYL